MGILKIMAEAPDRVPPFLKPCPTRIHRGLGLLSMGLGMAILIGGTGRITSDAHEVIALAGYGSWGSLYLTLGTLLLVVNDLKWRRWLMIIGTFAYAVYGFSLAVAALEHPAVAFTGTVVFCWLSGFHLYCADKVRERMWWLIGMAAMVSTFDTDRDVPSDS